MKHLFICLLVLCAYGVNAQSKWNTNTLDTVVFVTRVPVRQFKLPEIPTGERKGQPVKLERELRYIDSSLNRIKR
jgi:hypothetical protein